VEIVQSNREREGEFVNTALRDYFASKGILHRLSYPLKI
jgi:hypothetical protein